MTEITLMTLAKACEVVFGNAIKPATLRVEAARGRLVITRIGRKDFVTYADLMDMQEKCRVTPREPSSSATRRPAPAMPMAERAAVAHAAALASARKARETPNKATSPRARAAALRSASRT